MDANIRLAPKKQDRNQKELIRDFMKRFDVLRREQEELKDQVKDLEEEFKEEGLDLKTLKMVMKVFKIIAKVQHQGTYDEMFEQLEKELVLSAT